MLIKGAFLMLQAGSKFEVFLSSKFQQVNVLKVTISEEKPTVKLSSVQG